MDLTKPTCLDDLEDGWTLNLWSWDSFGKGKDHTAWIYSENVQSPMILYSLFCKSSSYNDIEDIYDRCHLSRLRREDFILFRNFAIEISSPKGTSFDSIVVSYIFRSKSNFLFLQNTYKLFISISRYGGRGISFVRRLTKCCFFYYSSNDVTNWVFGCFRCHGSVDG